MSDRTKFLLTLALNKQLQTKIGTLLQRKSVKQKKVEDPDYLPQDINESDSEISDAENYKTVTTTAQIHQTGFKEHDATEKKGRDIQHDKKVINDEIGEINEAENLKISNNHLEIISEEAILVLEDTNKTDVDSNVVGEVETNSYAIGERDEVETLNFSNDNYEMIAEEATLVTNKSGVNSCNVGEVEQRKDENENTLTKRGQPRKRKRYSTSIDARRKEKMMKRNENHNVKDTCTEKCKQKCNVKIPKETQTNINIEFWKLTSDDQKMFVMNCCKRRKKKRCTIAGDNSVKVFTFSYYLNNKSGEEVQVCKRFLLAVLGYDIKNDRILKSVRYTDASKLTPKPDQRGRQPNPKKIDRQVIFNHINSFNPSLSHYRREHAPLRKYLPSDINITLMFNDFKQKHSNVDISYELYRKTIKEMNISFTKLGHEECWYCEIFELHEKNSKHDKDVVGVACEECEKWKEHKGKYIKARKEYKRDVEGSKEQGGLCVSADLQKVIMIPRIDMFKEVIFTKRIIVFNESFVPVGKEQRKEKPLAAIWHEGVAGRSKEDLISTFYAFFNIHRDEKHITMWLDNCSAQNKNWALICFFVYIVNSVEVVLNSLDIKYFETGHTFMSADSFHHQIELSLKATPKAYYFNDFKSVVQKANSSRVEVIDMTEDKFYNWVDDSSKYKIKRTQPRPYLNNIVWLSFKRGKHTLRYKTDMEGEFTELNFLNAKAAKSGISKPTVRTQARGIDAERKNNLLLKLKPVMPANRLQFWKDLPTTNIKTSDLDE